MSKSFEETEAGARAFGERLRREREMRGISLEEIAATTRIGKRFLCALEDGQFDLLPGGIFNKGYVRAYARHLGIDEERAVADYLKAANETPADARLTAQPDSSARADGFSRVTNRAFLPGGFPLIPVLILLVVIAGAAGGWHLYQQRQRERLRPGTTSRQPLSVGRATNPNSSGNSASEPVRPGSSESAPDNARVSPEPSNAPDSPDAAVHTVEAAESSPRSSTSDAASGASTPADATPFEVTVRAKDRAWVEIKADGKVLLRGAMNAADVKTIRATNKVVFWTGNAGAVELAFNGKNVPLDGGENDEQVLVFNPRGLLPRPAAQ